MPSGLTLRLPRADEENEFLRAHRATSPETPSFLLGYEEGTSLARYLEMLADWERGAHLPPRHVPSTFLFAFAGARIAAILAATSRVCCASVERSSKKEFSAGYGSTVTTTTYQPGYRISSLPSGYRSGTVSIIGYLNPAPRSPQETNYANNDISTTVSFETAPAASTARALAQSSPVPPRNVE